MLALWRALQDSSPLLSSQAEAQGRCIPAPSLDSSQDFGMWRQGDDKYPSRDSGLEVGRRPTHGSRSWEIPLDPTGTNLNLKLAHGLVNH